MTTKKHFIFVHGASHGAWCWYKVRSKLEQLGHTITCLDLAGSGVNANDPKNITSFDEYNSPLLDFVSTLPDAEKVILVGHSAGGLSITRVLHEFGNKIEAAVYVAATMLRNGLCTDEDFKAASPDLSELGDRIKDLRAPDGLLKPEYQRMLLYNLSPLEDAILASMLLRPSPAFYANAQFIDGDNNVDRVKRVFVKTQNDKLLKEWQQDMMMKLWPPNQVFYLDSDHSPFFSTPDQLCDVLLQV